MSEQQSRQERAQEQPFLTVSYDLTPEVYERGLRYNLWIHFFKFLGIVVVILLLLNAVIDLYYAVSNGIPLEVMFRQANFLRMEPFMWVLYGAIILVYAVRLLVVYPNQMMKKTAELFGSDQKWNQYFHFYDRFIRAGSDGEGRQSTSDISYDIISKVKIRKYDIWIRTSGKNALSIYREMITSDQQAQILTALRTHCPNARIPQKDD